eukprot:TRINITY_DN2415_c0_g3_i1.p1 TRINITY_DN2415_c0_g3~~TRINITY_DN2415_c0_g3_i1.p1  ORF type:complete len:502 (+),score=115.84 TRINITY_DN2415_c0_g3_i1:960-2465(+)
MFSCCILKINPMAYYQQVGMGKFQIVKSVSLDDVNEVSPLNPLKGGRKKRPQTLPMDGLSAGGKRKSLTEAYFDNLEHMTHGSSRESFKTEGEGTTNWQTFLLVFKSFIGTGVLVLPKAFVNGGVLASSLFMVFVAMLNTYVMIKLSITKDVVGEGRLQDIGRLAGGKWMELWVSFSVVFIQVAAGCMYFIFMGSTLYSVIEELTGCTDAIPESLYCLLLVPFIAPLVCIRDLKKLMYPALLADVLIVGGLVYIFAYAIYRVDDGGRQDYDLFNANKFPIFLGTALFSFEGVCLVLPIKSAMKDPLAYPKVLMSVMICLAAIYTSFSVANYLAHGKNMETAIILELPKGSVPVLLVQLAYVLAIGFTFPLQFYPAVQVLENLIWKPLPPLSDEVLPVAVVAKQNMFRAVLTTLAAVIAIGGSTSFDNFTALGGALCSMPLLFVFPPLFHYLLVPHLTMAEKVIDITITVMGIILTLGTTGWTLKTWIEGDDDDSNSTCVPF